LGKQKSALLTLYKSSQSSGKKDNSSSASGAISNRDVKDEENDFSTPWDGNRSRSLRYQKAKERDDTTTGVSFM